jgi:hypothetical protein
MRKLSDITIDTMDIANQQETGITSNMQQLGFIQDGQVNGKLTISQNINLQNHQDSNGLNQEDWHNKVDAILALCFDTLKTYGKTYDQMDSISSLFKMVLKKYSYQQIESAFVKYLTIKTEMPTPADIVAIIDPATQPKKWSATAFIDIKKRSREGQYITPEQRKYCEDYIKAQIESNSPEMAETVSMVAIEDKKYWSIS